LWYRQLAWITEAQAGRLHHKDREWQAGRLHHNALQVANRARWTVLATNVVRMVWLTVMGRASRFGAWYPLGHGHGHGPTGGGSRREAGSSRQNWADFKGSPGRQSRPYVN
jgi:hypothetical protein